MVYRTLADLVVVVHFGFVVFAAVGGLLVRRRPVLAWLHLPALAWAVGILTVGYECPLTALEQRFRRLGGEPGYSGGFVDHYIENVLYPQWLTPFLLTLAAAGVLWGYAGLLRRHPSRPAAADRGARRP
jgi:hypothetical protein